MPKALPVAYLLEMVIVYTCCWAEMLVRTMDVQTTLGKMIDGPLGTKGCVEGWVLNSVDEQSIWGLKFVVGMCDRWNDGHTDKLGRASWRQ